METNLYIKLITQLRLNIAKKNLFFKIPLNKQEIDLILLLSKRGVVRRFFKTHSSVGNKQLYVVYPNYTYLNNGNLRIKTFNKNADHITLTLNALKLLNQASGTSSFIVKTDKGVCTHQDAIKHNTGGVLICLLY